MRHKYNYYAGGRGCGKSIIFQIIKEIKGVKMEKIDKNLLVTTSLIGSIKWYKQCPPSWKEKAEKDLHNTLARIWTEPDPNGPIARGMNFEKMVYNLLENGFHSSEVDSSSEFKKVMDYCEGARFQAKEKSIEEINGQSFCLYGKSDCLFPQKIVDLKTTGKPANKHNYLDSFQHILYLYLWDLPLFEYYVVVFEDDSDRNKITDLCKYSFENPGKKILKNIVYEKVTDMMNFFNEYPEYWDLYITKFSRW